MTTLRFHGSAAVLLLPLALFVAVTARLFISEAAFDLTGLAAAGVLTLFSGSLLAKAPSEYWKAAVRGASSKAGCETPGHEVDSSAMVITPSWAA